MKALLKLQNFIGLFGCLCSSGLIAQDIVDVTTLPMGGGHAQGTGIELFSTVGQFLSPVSSATAGSVTLSSGFVSVIQAVSDAEGLEVEHIPVSLVAFEQPIEIMATVSDVSQVASAVLEYRNGGEVEFLSQAMTNTGGNQFTAIIPASGVTSQGLEYRLKVTTINGFELRHPASNVYGVRVQLTEGLEKDAPQAAKRYDLVSLPIDANNKNLLSLLGISPYDSSKVRIFDIDPGRPTSDSSPYVERSNGGSLPAGRALFLILKESKTLSTGPGTSVITTSEYTVPLNANWTFVGDPFHFNLPLSHVSDNAGSVVGKIFEFNPNTANFRTLNSLTDVLRPFLGYVIFSGNQGNTLRFSPTEALVSPQASPAETHIWSINIAAQSMTAADLDNLAAVSMSARQDQDEFDNPEPPVIGDFVSLYFSHPEWNWLLNEFSTDVKSYSETGHTWDFAVKSNVRDQITITVNEFENVPTDLDIFLVDETLRIMRDVRRTNSYTIGSLQGGHSRRLKLVVGHREFVDEQIAALELLPEGVELGQNFPNPFNPSTTIRYGLPFPGTVTLKIFNLLGEGVATLVNNEALPPGFHTAVWDGLDHDGEAVASGIYIYYLQTDNIRIAKKMAFMK